MAASHTDQDISARRWSRALDRRLPWLLALVFTLLAGVALWTFAETERQRWEVAQRNGILVQLDTIRSRLEGALTAPLLRTRGMAAQIIAHGDISQAEFDTIAEYLLRGYRHVRNIVVSRGMIIAMSYPLAGNESVIGVNYAHVPGQYKMVLKAIETHAPVLQGPVPLIQGGTGLIARFPVFLRNPDGSDGRFFGMVNIILDIPAILDDAGLNRDDLPIAVAVRTRDDVGAASEKVFGDQAVFGQEPVTVDVSLPLGAWQLGAVPRGGWSEAERQLDTARMMIGAIFVLVALAAFGIAHYVTERARRVAVLRRRTEELQRSNADLERFAYVASHDLQTPLRNVASYAQLLERRYGRQLDADADQFISFIVDGCKRMSQMVVDLLNYAKVNSDAFPASAVAGSAAMAEVLTYLAPEIERTRAEVVVDPLPTVMASASQLVSLLQNLVSNALKYRHPERTPMVAVRASRADEGMWRFSVSDNGIGIEEQYFDQIFNFFERLHPQHVYEGTGVGLAICRRIVRRFGGDIWVESVPGQGSSFYFTLPDCAEAVDND
jgi:signal transduction histidine kinase